MALDFLEGFDYYPDFATAGIGFNSTYAGDIFDVTFENGRFAPGKALKFGGNNNPRFAYRALISTTSITFGFALKPIFNLIGATGKPIIVFQSTNGNPQFCLGYDNLGGIRVAQAQPGTLATALAVSGDKLLPNSWHYIEIELVLSDTVGRIKVYLDGKAQYELTNIDTKGSVDGDIGRLMYFADGFISYQLDDIYVLYGEATARGESRIQLLKPSSDAAVQFTPNGGANNFSRVNEVPVDGDTTYNGSNTVNQQDLFGFEDITVNPEQIHGIEIITAARKEDAGTRTIQNRIKSAAVEAAGPNTNLITDYRWVRSVHALNPDGNIAWSKAAINAMQVGYKLIL
jgi:hypothetical protein